MVEWDKAAHQVAAHRSSFDINFSKKNSKNIFGSELSETNNEPIFSRLHQKIDKISRKKIEKNYFSLKIVCTE